MSSVEYQKDGSATATRNDGQILLVSVAPQSVMDSTLATFFQNDTIQTPRDLLDPILKALVTLLIQKNVFTKVELRQVLSSLNIDVP